MNAPQTIAAQGAPVTVEHFDVLVVGAGRIAELAAGSLSATPDGQYETRFRLHDTQRQQENRLAFQQYLIFWDHLPIRRNQR